ncbi:hypothetical protein PPERSA_02364 [Pseudocohnilembus persalinus]|uniref:Uncharacterized protein n=1 Tax=Pseudocohnilembus persalinus TaxID=266149 RepID=A0A0V0QV51_PSEPJ|nr:hypothetical protein PPERSA_02364 [Pseudocohnilembus persalinus]|eukprot:KRX05832.1 hypothetical protein PPERSA_02364 [Pseudocohnilembus persalinus]
MSTRILEMLKLNKTMYNLIIFQENLLNNYTSNTLNQSQFEFGVKSPLKNIPLLSKNSGNSPLRNGKYAKRKGTSQAESFNVMLQDKSADQSITSQIYPKKPQQ